VGPEEVPDIYTHGHHEAVLRSHRSRTVENSAAYLLPHLRPGLDLLDVGCGPGSLTVDLARQVDPGRVVGIDLSAEVIAEASSVVATVANVSFIAGDFRTTTFEPASYDVVHAHQVLQHLRDPVGALRAMRALTRPNGVVAIRDSDYSAMTWAPASSPLERWRQIYLAVTRHNGAEADAGRWLLRWAHQAGFADVTYSTSTWTFATPSARQWWAELWAERTRHSAFAVQAVEYGIATGGEMEDAAAGWQAWATDEDAVFVVPHGEVIARA